MTDALRAPHAAPDRNVAGGASAGVPLLSVSQLTKHFPIRRGVFGREAGAVRAVDGVSLQVARGETLGIVGESGCGKTTLGRCILRLLEPTSGQIHFDGIDVRALDSASMRRLRRRMQIIFQDPFSSLNPRMTVGAIVREGLTIHKLAAGAEADKRVRQLLDRSGYDPNTRRDTRTNSQVASASASG